MRDRDPPPRTARNSAEESGSKRSPNSIPTLSKVDITPGFTEIYDGYLEEYGDKGDKGSTTMTGSPSRPQAWMAKGTISSPSSPNRSGTGSASKTASPVTGGSLRRKLRRRPTGSVSSVGRTRNRAYDEEDEEGYVSGDYEDQDHQFVKILVKVCVFPLDRKCNTSIYPALHTRSTIMMIHVE
jgi:hypothetical protein